MSRPLAKWQQIAPPRQGGAEALPPQAEQAAMPAARHHAAITVRRPWQDGKTGKRA